MQTVNIKMLLYTTGAKLERGVKVLPLSLLKESQGLGSTVNELYVWMGVGYVWVSLLVCM